MQTLLSKPNFYFSCEYSFPSGFLVVFGLRLFSSKAVTLTVTMAEPLTMFVVIRKDLTKTLNWNTGSVIAQACHASTAVLHATLDTANTKEYLEDVHNMHKVILETKNAESLEKLVDALQAHDIPLFKWVEQPENIPTSVATAPLRGRSPEVKDIFKKYCSLYR